MATPTAANVGVGAAKVTGAIFVAPDGTALPTSASASLANTYKCLGFTSEEGITISEDSSNTAIRAWEGRTEVYNIKTEFTEKISFTPIECNDDVAKLVWGAENVTVSGTSLTVKHHGATMAPVSVVIEVVPKVGFVERYCCRAQLVERGEAKLDGQSVSGRALTFNCLADANGVTMTEYIAAVTTTGA